jgi:hypothetical protein
MSEMKSKISEKIKISNRFPFFPKVKSISSDKSEWNTSSKVNK